MSELKWWSKLLIFSGVLVALLLISGPLSYQFGLGEFIPAIATLLVALLGGVLVMIGAIVMVFVAQRKDLSRDRSALLTAIFIGILPVIVVAPQIFKAQGVPPIHDISTDTVNPPTFHAIVGLRKETDNSLEYALNGSAEELAAVQKAAYPDLATYHADLSVEEAVSRASQLLTEQGHEVVNEDVSQGVVEAVATTFWFGFKDDFIVRVVAEGDGSKIDVRSMSRVGRSDIGANAAQIMEFAAQF